MGVLNLIEDPPAFTAGTILSAALLNVLQRDALALDEVSRMGLGAFSDFYGEPPENNSANPVTRWRGGFTFVTGVTSLVIVTSTSGQQSGDVLRVYRNATSGDLTLANGGQIHTIDISAAGYADGEVVEVKMDLYNASAGGDYDWGSVEILYAYIGPIGLADAYPGLPTFGAVTAAALNQISDAAAWLIRRVGQRIEPLFQATIRRPGPFLLAGVGGTQTTVKWSGSIVKTAGHDTLEASIIVQQKATGRTETVRLRLGGSTVDSFSVPGTLGDHPDTLVADLSAYSDGDLIPLVIDHIKTAPLDDQPDTSRSSIYRVATAPTGGSPVSLAALGSRSSITYGPDETPGTLANWLTELCAILAGVEARIDANPEIWARQYLYRARFGIDDTQFRQFEPWSVASTLRRAGEQLIVRGKGVSVGYGPGRFIDGKDNEVGAQTFENFRTQALIDADAVETQRIYLDTIPGLPVGAPYNLRGEDLYYAAEQIKIVEAGA